MPQIFTFSILMLLSLSIHAQTIADFENFGLTAGEFLNDAEGDVFASGNVRLPNDYDEEGMFWQGWAISAATDTLTPGFLNQYSSITGGGAEGSLSYAISYAFTPQVVRLMGDAQGAPVTGLYLTNTTYTYLGMRDGIGPAKAFGGPTGDDPDFLLLTMHGFYNGELTTDSVDFYLGDFRAADNSQDYLVQEWTWVDLSSLGNVDSLQFSITGSDLGEFGLNTPAYICLDHITTSDRPVATQNLATAVEVNLWPNPTQDRLTIDWPLASTGQVVLLNLRGQVVKSWRVTEGQVSVSLADLTSGTYWLHYQLGNQVGLQQVVKQ